MEKFVNLKQGRICVKEYALKFYQLSWYAPDLLADRWTGIRKFTSRLNRDLILETKIVLLNKDMDISRLTVHMQQVKDVKRKQVEIGDRQGKRSRFSNQEMLSLRVAEMVAKGRKRCEGVLASGGQSISSCPPCQFCGHPYWGYRDEGRDKFFKFVQAGHQLRDCLVNKVSMGANKIPVASYYTSTPGGTVFTSITTLGSSVSRNRLYALAS
ncbi:uncharacterized protein LOC107865229 [Capsicum annuum]|uniref:uncharacterized protein LOC107865229 n=1 Tax=Capsicum annuum TaxID=4072 RepID=UPI0007BF048C|nr:uncharacterized protein LOC107865229 [Capsicum annuum]